MQHSFASSTASTFRISHSAAHLSCSRYRIVGTTPANAWKGTQALSAPLSFSIEEASEMHLPRLLDFISELADEKLDVLPTLRRPSLEKQRAFLDRMSASERSRMLLAVTPDQRIVGQLELHVDGRPETKHSGHIGVSVAKEWRGLGVSRSLIDRVIELIRQWADFCRLELEVYAWNERAIRFYLGAGFVVEGRKRNAVVRRGFPEDVLLMARVTNIVDRNIR
jgi:RimJ/RimL family protein N-acetyltransferase